MTTTSDQYIRAINDRDFSALEELMHPDVVLHHPIGTYEGLNEVLGFYRDIVFPMATKLELRGEVLCGESMEMFRGVGMPSSADDEEIEPKHIVDVFERDGQGRVTTSEVYLRSF